MLVKALFAFLVLPGIFSGLVPVILSINDPWLDVGSISFGAFCIVIGLIVLLGCVKSFYVFGNGTLAPWEPPKKLVIVGLYQYTRNPMYIGVLTIIGGIAFFRGSPLVAVYGGFMAIAFHLRVVLNEEKWLATQFSDEWVKYMAEVSRWMPKVKPYRRHT